MKYLVVNKKTGFINKSPLKAIIIRDFRGKLFYSTEGLKPVKFFNLPAGSYFVETGDFVKASKPIKFKLSKLPPFERKFPLPTDFVILFDDNPNKCTIRWGYKEIVYDNKLKQADLPTLYFMLYHEHGHHLYATEKYADQYSRNMMIKKGFNPSQIGKAHILSLSNKQIKRKKYIVNTLIK